MSPEQAMPDLVNAITELDEPGALALVQARLEAGVDPFAIMAACRSWRPAKPGCDTLGSAMKSGCTISRA